MKSEFLFDLPWRLLLGFFLGTNVSFLLGYCVFSDLPFLQVADLTFVTGVIGQLSLFWLFFVPLLVLGFRLATLADSIPLPEALKNHSIKEYL